MSIFDKCKKNAVEKPGNLREVIKSLEKNEIIMKQADNKNVSAPDDCKQIGRAHV